MSELVTMLSNFGFPVTIACYLLFRFEKILSGLQKTNEDLVAKNTDLISRIDGLKLTITELKDIISKKRK